MAKEKTKKRIIHSNVIVIGLGRFGSSLARELMKTGHEVLGVDTDERIVQNMSQELTHTVRADTTDEATLKELGISEFDSAVVAIGADLEASILTTALLLQLGVPNVWAKANSTSHGLILDQLGCHHVIFPEYEMGKRVAHMVSGETLDYVPIDNDFVMVKSEVPASFAGKTLAETVAGKEGLEATTVGPFTWLTRGTAPFGSLPMLSDPEGIQMAGETLMETVFSLEPGGTAVAFNEPETVCYAIRLAGLEPGDDTLRERFLDAASDPRRLEAVAETATRTVYSRWLADVTRRQAVEWKRPPR